MSKRLLIVDDEPLIRRALMKLLSGQNRELFEAKDGQEGFELWTSKTPDLVMLDILMPFKTGPQLLAELKPKYPHTKVVLMSAYAGEYDLNMAQRMGADHFIAKPFEDLQSIVNIVNELL